MTRMDTKLIEWINLAVSAPSGDNCQPWDLKFFDQKFRIEINQERAEHFLDQDQSASWISLGCLCENLHLSAKSFGFDCTFVIESASSVVVLWEKITPEVNADLLEIIRSRHTYRGKMEEASLDLNEYNECYKEVPGRSLFEWRVTPKISKKLIVNWSWLETVLWLKTSLMRDFTKWLRGKNEKFSDGFTFENLHIPWLDQLFLKMFKKMHGMINLVPFFIFEIKSYLRLKFLIEKSSGVLWLAGPMNDYRDYFYAGMEIQRMWLYLTKKKIRSQPLAIQSLFLNFVGRPQIARFLSPAQRHRIQSIKENTYQELNISQSLVFLFRFGRSTEVSPLLPRRRVYIE